MTEDAEMAAAAFLDSHDVNYRTESSDRILSAADVADRAKKFTVLVECWR